MKRRERIAIELPTAGDDGDGRKECFFYCLDENSFDIHFKFFIII